MLHIVPVLYDHEQYREIGNLSLVGDKLIAEFVKPVTRTEVFEIFGNIGFLASEFTLKGNDFEYTKIHITHWALSLTPASKG